MKNRLGLVGIWLLALFPASPAVAQRLQGPISIESAAVAGNVHMLTGRGGNIGLLVDDKGAILVDDQFAPHADAIVAAVKEATPHPIRFLINTHWHGDHTGGNAEFNSRGVVLVAHDNVRKRMSTEQFNELFGRKTPPSPDAALPTVTFSEGMTFHWGKEEVRIVHVGNAHTDGDSFVHFVNAHVLHMGDVYFNGMYPFIDVSSGGSLDGLIAAVEQALAMTDDKFKIIPGHGPLATRADLSSYRALLIDVRKIVGALIREGKSLDQILAAAPLAKYDAKWGRGFMNPKNFLRCVHAAMTKKPR
ncbi:MAG: MBL fold metallo-hydrolase [Planctomycetota bacterium]